VDQVFAEACRLYETRRATARQASA